MIPKIGRGQKMGGLLVYLLGGGQHNEHKDRHVIAGSPTVMRTKWMAHFDGAKDERASRNAALEIARELDIPRKLYGTKVKMKAKPAVVGARGPGADVVERAKPGEASVLRDAPVWHCVLALNPDEELTDEQWQRLVNDFMDEMGFSATPDGSRAQARWVAVRHGRSGEHANGNDHIHIAASLVREDGQKVDTYFRDPVTGRPQGDYRKAQNTCNLLEHRHGLKVLWSREDGSALSGNSRAEIERAKRLGLPETERETLRRLVRAFAVASETEAEFVRRCRDGGVSVAPRYAKGGEEVAGYKYRLRSPEGEEQGPWLSGSKGLAADLSLTELRKQWDDNPQARAEAVTLLKGKGARTGREAVTLNDPELWLQASRDLQRWNDRLAGIPPEDRAGWAYVAGRAAGAFAAWSRRVEPKPGVFAGAVAELTRSAQLPRGRGYVRRPPAARQENVTDLRNVALILTQLQKRDGRDPLYESLLLIQQLMLTLQAIADAHGARQELDRALRLRSQALAPLQEMHTRYADVYRQHQQETAGTPERISRREEELRAAGLDDDAIRQHLAATAGGTSPGAVAPEQPAEQQGLPPHRRHTTMRPEEDKGQGR